MNFLKKYSFIFISLFFVIFLSVLFGLVFNALADENIEYSYTVTANQCTSLKTPGEVSPLPAHFYFKPDHTFTTNRIDGFFNAKDAVGGYVDLSLYKSINCDGVYTHIATSTSQFTVDTIDEYTSSCTEDVKTERFFTFATEIEFNSSYCYALISYWHEKTSGNVYWKYNDDGVASTTSQTCLYSGGITYTCDNQNHGIFEIYGYTDLPDTDNKLTWFFPEQDANLSNNEWNDWGLYYDLESGDIGDWNLLTVWYTDSNNKTYHDYDFIATTTDLTYWTINRENALPDGIVYSWGILSKIEDCDNYYDSDCIWTDVGQTSVITWNATSTGGTVFDFGEVGFIPATTSQDENLTYTQGIVKGLYRIFPFSIIEEINTIIKEKSLTATSSIFTLQDFIPSQYYTFNNDADVINPTLLQNNLSVWSTKIYPALSVIIYFFTFIYILFRVTRIAKK